MKLILRQELLITWEPDSGRSWTSKVFNTVITLDTYQFLGAELTRKKYVYVEVSQCTTLEKDYT